MIRNEVSIPRKIITVLLIYYRNLLPQLLNLAKNSESVYLTKKKMYSLLLEINSKVNTSDFPISSYIVLQE